MLLTTYRKGNGRCLAFLVSERVYDCHRVHPGLPETAEAFLAEWERYQPLAELMFTALINHSLKREIEYAQIGATEDVQALVGPVKTLTQEND